MKTFYIFIAAGGPAGRAGGAWRTGGGGTMPGGGGPRASPAAGPEHAGSPERRGAAQRGGAGGAAGGVRRERPPPPGALGVWPGSRPRPLTAPARPPGAGQTRAGLRSGCAGRRVGATSRPGTTLGKSPQHVLGPPHVLGPAVSSPVGLCRAQSPGSGVGGAGAGWPPRPSLTALRAGTGPGAPGAPPGSRSAAVRLAGPGTPA